MNKSKIIVQKNREWQKNWTLFTENYKLQKKINIMKVKVGFPHSLAGKESACSAGDLCLIPGLGRYPGEW